MSASDSSTSGFRRRLGILSFQAATLIAGLVLLEVGLRGFLRMKGEPYDADGTLQQAMKLPRTNREFLPKEAQDRADAAPASVEAISLHPYLGWEFDPGFNQIDMANHALHSTEDYGALNIFVVGGSVAASFCVAESTAGTLVECLSADPDLPKRRMSILSLARGGFKEPQQINFVVYMLSLGFTPDVVINIDGFNEVALGNHNHTQGSHPVFPSAAHWSNLIAQGASDDVAFELMGEIRDKQTALETWSDRFVNWHLERSCLLGTLALKRMHTLRLDAVNRFGDYGEHLAGRKEILHMHGPRFEGDDEAAVDASVRVWKESSRSLNDICRERGIIYIHVLQPTLHYAGSKPVTAREIEHGTMVESWTRGVVVGYPKLRQEGEDLRRLGVDFIDASMLFADHPEDLYYDACHYVGAGHVILAKRICSELLRRLKDGR